MSISNLQGEAPIVLSGVNRQPLPLGTGSVDIVLVDRSHRWLLVDRLHIQVNSRLERQSIVGVANFSSEQVAAIYEAKVQTKLVSLTDEFVPLLGMTTRIATNAETSDFLDSSATNPPSVVGLAALTHIEWLFPRPLLLRPGEAVKVTIRQSAVPSMLTAYAPLGTAQGNVASPPGAFFNVALKGRMLPSDFESPEERAVPLLVATTFDQRDVPGPNATTALEKNLENNTKRVLMLHTMLGRWNWWQSLFVPPIVPVFNQELPAPTLFEYPLVSIHDYTKRAIVDSIPFESVFPPQVAGTLDFNGVMQPRDVLKVTLAQDPRLDVGAFGFLVAPFTPDSIFQGIVALNAWRMEPV